MIGEKAGFQILKKGLSFSKADQTELVLEEEKFSLTRFSENIIHQNTMKIDHRLIVKTIFGKRIGIAETNRLDDDSLKNVVENASTIARNMPQDNDFVSLPKNFNSSLGKLDSNNLMETFTPDEMAGKVKEIVRVASLNNNLIASGALETENFGLAVVNSEGVQQYLRKTSSNCSISMLSKSSGATGWAQVVSRKLRDLNVVDAALKAAKKASFSVDLIEIPPSEYTVILEEGALGQLLLFLGFLGFGAKTLLSGRSFMRIGEKICGENVTIIEDANNPLQIREPFDYEGVPKKRVVLIEKGIAKEVVYDSYFANKVRTNSTGHALRPGNTFGPYPKNLVFSTGEMSEDELISSTKKGILITRFWYINYLNPMKTEITGTTRDGTFLIVDGKIKNRVKDMRIGQSILEALNNVEEIGNKLHLFKQYGSYLLVPWVKIRNFKFI